AGGNAPFDDNPPGISSHPAGCNRSARRGAHGVGPGVAARRNLYDRGPRKRAFIPSLLAPALILLLGAADEPELVPDVSQRTVEIQYSFTGANLLLFGAIVYPDGRRPKKPADIVVILKGPDQSIIMREKEKVAGIWVNADRARFRSA